MIDLGQIELAQITDRLLKSRNRPKRQYLIERIGHIWSGGHRCCLIPSENSHFTHHRHTAPTKDSIAAVASFECDELLNVRIAVTFALRHKSVPDSDKTSTLVRMLNDDHPIIRANAAHALSHAACQSLEPDQLNAALTNATWTVRWVIAESLATTAHAELGWATLRASVPSSILGLSYSIVHCLPYAERFSADESLVSEIRDRFHSIPEADYLRLEISRDFNQLLAQSCGHNRSPNQH